DLLRHVLDQTALTSHATVVVGTDPGPAVPQGVVSVECLPTGLELITVDPVGDGFLDVYLYTADGVDEVSKAHHVDHGVVLDVQVEVVADHGLEGVRGRVTHGRVDRQFPRVVGHRLVDVVEQQIEAHRLRITFGQLGVLGKLCVFHVARQSHQDGVTGGGVDAGHHHGVGPCSVALGVGV